MGTGFSTGSMGITGRDSRAVRDMRLLARKLDHTFWKRFNSTAQGQVLTSGGNDDILWDGGDRYMKTTSFFTHSQASNQEDIVHTSNGEYDVLVLLRLVWTGGTDSTPPSVGVEFSVNAELVTGSDSSLSDGISEDTVYFWFPGPHNISGTDYDHSSGGVSVDRLLAINTIITVPDDLDGGGLYVRTTTGTVATGSVSVLDSSSIRILKLSNNRRV